LKYHIHVHCLVTFGGLKDGQWVYPKRKHKIAPFRTLCSTFRTLFLKDLKVDFDQKRIQYHQCFEQIEHDLGKKRWVVNHQKPTTDTKVIEEYLGRYVCRIAISNNRIRYDQAHQKVTILFNDYTHQKTGKAAPKKTKTLTPLVAIQHIVQHVLPPYFQKVRHYGLHATNTHQKVKHLIPHLVRSNTQSIRSLFQILNTLLGIPAFECPHCQCTNFTTQNIPGDPNFLNSFLNSKNNKSPPQSGVGIKNSLLKNCS